MPWADRFWWNDSGVTSQSACDGLLHADDDLAFLFAHAAARRSPSTIIVSHRSRFVAWSSLAVCAQQGRPEDLTKPDPRIYERALKALGATATETIMVGDSFRSDVDGPSNVGILGIHLVRSGVSSPSACVVPTLKAILERAK
jgi:ribonucleotide monophosphatase NagD (HAD superfamily)